MIKINKDCAAICGLFCGTCPEFMKGHCQGCLSHICTCDCFNGFKDCAKEQGVTRCYECSFFPCEKLQEFSLAHVVNGIGHHKHVIKDLLSMQRNGVDAWIQMQTEKNTCSKCGHIKLWYHEECEHCKQKK